MVRKKDTSGLGTGDLGTWGSSPTVLLPKQVLSQVPAKLAVQRACGILKATCQQTKPMVKVKSKQSSQILSMRVCFSFETFFSPKRSVLLLNRVDIALHFRVIFVANNFVLVSENSSELGMTVLSRPTKASNLGNSLYLFLDARFVCGNTAWQLDPKVSLYSGAFLKCEE